MNLADSYNETTDIGTTLLGPVTSNPDLMFHQKYSFPMNSMGFVTGMLSDGQEVECLIDIGAKWSIMSHAFFEASLILAKLPRYKPIHPYLCGCVIILCIVL